MPRAFGFSFSSVKGLVVFLVLLVVFVFAYHRILQRSVRNHPEATLRAVQEHCRYMLGKQLGTMPQAELAAKLQQCSDIRVRSVEVAGGVFDPVFVRITLDPQPPSPLGETVFIFKSADIGPRSLNLLSSLSGLATGRWMFNSSTVYSHNTFCGSF